jgi:hypothetical protein
VGIVDRAYRLLVGCIPVAGLALQFWLMAHYPTSKSLLTTATQFLSFFTIQTNIPDRSLHAPSSDHAGLARQSAAVQTIRSDGRNGVQRTHGARVLRGIAQYWP